MPLFASLAPANMKRGRPRLATIWRYARLPVLALLIYLVFFKRERVHRDYADFSDLMPRVKPVPADTKAFEALIALDKKRFQRLGVLPFNDKQEPFKLQPVADKQDDLKANLQIAPDDYDREEQQPAPEPEPEPAPGALLALCGVVWCCPFFPLGWIILPCVVFCSIAVYRAYESRCYKHPASCSLRLCLSFLDCSARRSVDVSRSPFTLPFIFPTPPPLLCRPYHRSSVRSHNGPDLLAPLFIRVPPLRAELPARPRLRPAQPSPPSRAPLDPCLHASSSPHSPFLPTRVICLRAAIQLPWLRSRSLLKRIPPQSPSLPPSMSSSPNKTVCVFCVCALVYVGVCA